MKKIIAIVCKILRPLCKMSKNLKTGKSGELLVMSRMLAEGFDVYAPLVDDHGVDAIVRWKNGPFLQVQIRARNDREDFDTTWANPREGPGFFVFCSKAKGRVRMWIMPREEVQKHETKGGIDFSVKEKQNIFCDFEWEKFLEHLKGGES